MFYSLFTIGKPGGCKSTANAKILYELYSRMGVYPQIVSDRLLLEEAVIRDILSNGIRRPDGSWEGEHSILFDANPPPGKKVFEVKDGTLLNRVHDEMIRLACMHDNPQGLLIEYAIGPDVQFGDREPLLQSGQSLIDRFAQTVRDEDHRVLVLEVDAGLDERLRRNGERVDGMKAETFRKFFPDGGELHGHEGTLSAMGVEYYFIDNDYNDLDRFLHEIEGNVRDSIRPFIEGVRTVRPEWEVLGMKEGHTDLPQHMARPFGEGDSGVPKVVFLTGIPGSGKSTVAQYLTPELESMGYRCTFLTDKAALEQEVREDVARYMHDPDRCDPDGTVRGDHTVLHNPLGENGTLQMEFIDGHALNVAHRKLLDYASRFVTQSDSQELLVIEWAYGSDVPYPGEGLRQTAGSLVDGMEERNIINQSIILDITAPLHVRAERNSRRPGHIPTGEFRLYFGDEGHFTAEDFSRIGPDRIRQIANVWDDVEPLTAELELVREEFITPWLSGEFPTRSWPEGQSILPRKEF